MEDESILMIIQRSYAIKLGLLCGIIVTRMAFTIILKMVKREKESRILITGLAKETIAHRYVH